jgi:hypothetical protein
MRATGLFFLRMHASTRCDASGQRVGVSLPVVERSQNAEGRWVVLNTLTAKWNGPQALAFFDANQAELRAGRPLNLELDRLHGHDGEWQAYVTRMELAPVAPSWRKDVEAAAPQQQQPQAAPAQQQPEGPL